MTIDTNRYKICIVGDELINGIGDSRFLGWTGRVMQRAPINEKILDLIDYYPLGKKGDTIKDIAERIRTDAFSRFGENSHNRLIISMTNNDNEVLSSIRTKASLAKMLDDVARTGVKTLVIGPPPRTPNEEEDIQERNSYFADACRRKNIQYIDIFSPLVRNMQWMKSGVSSNHIYPDQVGYGLIAWIVAHSNWDNFCFDN